MMDFHTHTLLSDGEFIPSELAARARKKGYTAIAITDHADSSNIEDVVKKTVGFVRGFPCGDSFRVVAGVELTHVPPDGIKTLVRKARRLGARLVVCHGETIVEPVAGGTNRAAIEAGVDILAHPGLISEEDARLARKNSVTLEITARKGHSLTNGHVASMAKRLGVEMVVNTDAHSEEDLLEEKMAARVALGAGLTMEDYKKIRENARNLLKKVRP